MEDIPKFQTPESYEQFAINVQERSPERARKAIAMAIDLRAEQYGAESQVERESLQAIFAYERMLFIKHGKRQRASYTWRAVQEHGILGAVERAVKKESAGYRLLVENGLEEKAFEAVILRHPSSFSEESVKIARERLERLKQEP
jgi:hypothetical protein